MGKKAFQCSSVRCLLGALQCTYPMLEEEITAAIQQSVRSAIDLSANDLAFHRSLSTDFSKTLDDCLSSILEITDSLLVYAQEEPNFSLRQPSDVDTHWGDVIDVVDTLLESSDQSLEELTLQAKREKESAALKHLKQQEKEPLPASLRNAQDLPRPQLKFERQPDNSDDTWVPLLTEKPHAKLSLADSLCHYREYEGEQRIGHPYAYEIDTIQYPDFVFDASEPIMYRDVDSTKATWVDTRQKLEDMLLQLRQSKEIAIDLEHHDFHSFRGFVCLMQISNRDQDWIVDTLALRKELVILNEVFTDPTILKVLHGANSDIIWLQRDFGLYIVNLFDTYHASKTLGLEGHGLAFLLQKYVEFDADKRYQLADWRIRPLPKEMLYYARSDTHYLLYIYDLMRNELLQKSAKGTHNVMASVLQASAAVSLRQYSKEPYDAAHGQGSDGWQFLLQRFYGTRAFSAQQLEVFKALHQWRDQKAREKDESTRFILPNAMLVSIAAALPKDTHSLLTVGKQVSSTMQANLQAILDVIQTGIKYANKQQEDANMRQVTVVESAMTEIVDVKSVQSQARPESSSEPLVLTIQSKFWGKLSADLGKARSAAPVLNLRLSVPMPALTKNVYVSDEARNDTAQTTDLETPEVPAKPQDEIFVVRDVNKTQAAKRKSDAIESSGGQRGPVEATGKSKARKKAKQAKIDDVESASPAQEEVQPFDYAAQPSLLKEKELKKSRMRKFGEFAGKIVRSKQVQGGKQSTFKR